MSKVTRYDSVPKGAATREDNYFAKLALAGGFIALILAVIAAHETPATGYELSIYRATPMVFWVGIGITLLVSFSIGVAPVSNRIRQAALVLGGATTVTVAGLPVVRGYYFYGSGDSLSHLGFAEQFATGAMSPMELLHPGVHITAIILGGASERTLEWALILTVVAFFAAFVLFVPLVARIIADDERALVLGLFTAALLLPINKISVHPVVHPTSQAVLFVPFVLYLVFNHVRAPNHSGSIIETLPLGVLLGLMSVAIILIHPQQALNIILLFGTVSGLQFIIRRYRPNHSIATHRAMYVPTAFIAIVFTLWAPRSERFHAALDTVVTGLLQGAAPAGDEIAQRSVSLEVLGGSIEELFIKLFLVSTIFALIAGVFMFANLTGRLGNGRTPHNDAVTYLSIGLIPVIALFGAFFVASYTTQPFRYLGFIMAIVTIVGAVALTYAVPRVPLSGRLLRSGLTVGFVLLFVLSLLSLHSSPYIYQGNSQVTKAQFTGYETTFDIRDPEVPFTGVSGGANRYIDAVYGPRTPAATEFPGDDDSVPGRVFSETRFADHYETDRYLIVTQADIERETRLYDGFRYSKDGFDALDATPRIDRVLSNEALDFYLIESENE